MEEDYKRPVPGHMVMNRNYVYTVFAKGLQNRGYFGFEHCDVAGDRGVLLSADKSRPGIQAHARVDRRAVLFDVQVVTPDRDFVDLAQLLAFVSDDLGNLGGVQGRAGTSLGWSGGWRRGVAHQIPTGVYALGQSRHFPPPMGLLEV